MAFRTCKIFDNGSDVAKCMERRADAITLGKKFYPSDLLWPFHSKSHLATEDSLPEELCLNTTQHKHCLFIPAAQKES